MRPSPLKKHDVHKKSSILKIHIVGEEYNHDLHAKSRSGRAKYRVNLRVKSKDRNKGSRQD